VTGAFVGPALAAVIAAAALTGCASFVWPGSHVGAPVRPAARLAPADEVDLLLAPSLGLASPEDAVVRVVGPQMTCSGTLIAEDLVLTAHHCIVERRGHGEFTARLVPAAALQVELGGDYLPWGNVGIKAVLAPPCGEGGGRGDVAVLVLERKLVGIATTSLRDDPPRTGDVVDPVGFGRCALSPEGIRRRQREGGIVGAVSKATFEVEASVCPGDSGGPALDRVTREVVGVVSLSAMDHDEVTRGRSVFARIDGLAGVVAYARLVADGADLGDLPPLSCDR
jgi:hypothetical protein